MSKTHHDNPDSEEPFRMPITDSLDLHTFRPHEVKDLVEDYLNESVRRGFHEVRIIHGKGTGVLREVVHGALKRSPLVRSFRLAPPEAGSWGATIVTLR
ncbi:MAG: Smr/MutS family protein [bacterium]